MPNKATIHLSFSSDLNLVYLWHPLYHISYLSEQDFGLRVSFTAGSHIREEACLLWSFYSLCYLFKELEIKLLTRLFCIASETSYRNKKRERLLIPVQLTGKSLSLILFYVFCHLKNSQWIKLNTFSTMLNSFFFKANWLKNILWKIFSPSHASKMRPSQRKI